jgi:ElaB/YqjD/DUF883 family membrane-anchored ribosome-binding protein
MNTEPISPKELSQYTARANEEIDRLKKAMRKTANKVRLQEEALRRAKHLLHRDPFEAWMVASDVSIPRN